MSGSSEKTNDYSSVLNAVVWIKQLGSYRTDLWAVRLFDQSVKPFSVDDLGIIIQEKQMLSLCLTRTKIVDGGEIKRLRVAKDAMFVRQRVKVMKGFRVNTGVVDDDDFVSRVTGFRFDARHTLLD